MRLPLRLRSRVSRQPLVDPVLRAEVESGAPWMYAWPLADGTTTPTQGPELMDVHRTRLELLQGPVQRALSARGSSRRVLDLACNEGWFAHRVLEWGASHVIGIDIRARVIRRAELIRAHVGIPPERLELRCADVFDLSTLELGSFDVVLCLGLIYHLENPVGALRIARAMTRGLCVIESQLTRQEQPIVLGSGRADQYDEAAASWAAHTEQDWRDNMLASAGGVVSFTPNRAALVQAAEAAGFAELEFARAQQAQNRQYRIGDRAVLFAHPAGRSELAAGTKQAREPLPHHRPDRG